MANGTNTETNAFTFIWKIEKFSYYLHQEMSSPTFFVHSIDSEFVLELFCGTQQSDEIMISCYLKLVRGLNCESSGVELDFEFSFLAIDGSPLISKEKVKKRLKEGIRRGFWDFMPLYDVVKNRRIAFLPQGALTLQCKIWKTKREMSETAVCFARTRMGIEQSSFVWLIEGFSTFKDDFTVPHSVRKASELDPSISMNFQLAGAFSEGKQFELELSPENVPQISTDKDVNDLSNKTTGFYDFKLSFLNASGDENFHHEKNRLESHKIHKLRVSITEDLLNVENGFLVDDVLSLKCHFTFYKGIVSEEIERTLFGSAAKSNFLDSRPVFLYHDSLSACISSLKDMYRFLYDTQMFCDVKLRTGTCCLSAHKSVLSAKSRVFQSMFEVQMKDDVKIPDVDVETLRKIIHYMYTDTINDMQLENIYPLFVAAKIYKIFALHKKCSLILSENLNKHNACEMLCFADDNDDKNFKSIVQEFILKNKEEVTGSTAWKILETRNTALAEEIYSLM